MDWLVLTLIMAIPGVAGEGLARWPLGRRPRVAIVIGALIALALVVAAGIAPALCHVGDDLDDQCDRKGSQGFLLGAAGIVAILVLTVLLLRDPQRLNLRRALWAVPLAVLAGLWIVVDGVL